MVKKILCSECFNDTGLKILSEKMGINSKELCPKCKSINGIKLTKENLLEIAYVFFVKGSIHRTEYGGAPIIQFNEYKKSNIEVSEWLKSDLKLLENKLGVGFFHYGPRLWMVGEIEPLKDFLEEESKSRIIKRIISESPNKILKKDDIFYRLRVNPNNPSNIEEYDTPPEKYCGNGRLDSVELPIMYASQDLEVCIHECRVTVEDQIYVSTLSLNRDIKLLDLTSILEETDTTEFESLDIAIYMLFLAGSHVYPHLRELAIEVFKSKYDGIIFPSYFSAVKTGGNPFETTYGLSSRKFQGYNTSIPNIALFNRPIKEKLVTVKCINKLLLKQIKYETYFGPVDF